MHHKNDTAILLILESRARTAFQGGPRSRVFPSRLAALDAAARNHH
jgi:hypothetical protein